VTAFGLSQPEMTVRSVSGSSRLFSVTERRRVELFGLVDDRAAERLGGELHIVLLHVFDGVDTVLGQVILHRVGDPLLAEDDVRPAATIASASFLRDSRSCSENAFIWSEVVILIFDFTWVFVTSTINPQYYCCRRRIRYLR